MHYYFHVFPCIIIYNRVYELGHTRRRVFLSIHNFVRSLISVLVRRMCAERFLLSTIFYLMVCVFFLFLTAHIRTHKPIACEMTEKIGERARQCEKKRKKTAAQNKLFEINASSGKWIERIC